MVEKYSSDFREETEYNEDVRATSLAWVVAAADPQTQEKILELAPSVINKLPFAAVAVAWYVIISQIKNEKSELVLAEITKRHFDPIKIKENIEIFEGLDKRFEYAKTHFNVSRLQQTFGQT